MCYSPRVQASMELSDRLNRAKARREIPAETPFRTKVKKGNEGALEMFCVDGSDLVIQALGSVLFWPNITDQASVV